MVWLGTTWGSYVHLSENDTIGFGFTSVLLRKWRKLSKQFTEHCKGKPVEFRITFDTQLNSRPFACA